MGTVAKSQQSGQSCKQDCLDFAERMKRKALKVRSEGLIYNVSALSMSFIFTTFAFGLSTLSWCTPLRTGLFLWIESI